MFIKHSFLSHIYIYSESSQKEYTSNVATLSKTSRKKKISPKKRKSGNSAFRKQNEGIIVYYLLQQWYIVNDRKHFSNIQFYHEPQLFDWNFFQKHFDNQFPLVYQWKFCLACNSFVACLTAWRVLLFCYWRLTVINAWAGSSPDCKFGLGLV